MRATAMVDRARRAGRTLELATAIADRAVVELVVSEGIQEERSGVVYYDTRPLLDSREQGPQDIDQHAQALLYGAMRGLLRHHATQVHLVHVQQHNTGTRS
jgi:hypothetical protein